MAIQVITDLYTEQVTTNTALSGGEISGTVQGELGTFEPIVDLLLKSKFQQLNKTRQQITGRINTKNGQVQPFDMFTDSKQNNKQFIVTGFTFALTQDSCEVTLSEYNNSDQITLTQ